MRYFDTQQETTEEKQEMSEKKQEVTEKKGWWDKLWSIELVRLPFGNDGRGTGVLLAPVLFMGIFITGLLIFDKFFAG